MKFRPLRADRQAGRSRPARGAWVEIPTPTGCATGDPSRPARGAWVEMPCVTGSTKALPGRAPQGARGLKSLLYLLRPELAAVAPRKGRVG